MPIGDLLAQISAGDAPKIPTPKAAAFNRTVDDNLDGTQNKQSNNISTAASTQRSLPRPDISKKASSNGTLSGPGATAKSTIHTGNGPSPASRTSAAKDEATIGLTKVPKKGSFAEIMARGKAAQTTFSQIGKIQHKPLEKSLSKKERMQLKESRKDDRPLKKRPKTTGDRSKNGESSRDISRKSEKVGSRSAIPEKKVKKAATATTGYTGTARPMPGKTSSVQRSTPKAAVSSKRRYSSDGEDDEEEEIDDGEGYYSDESSDMEAAAYEVDEEEERAARIARKEDDKALREENEHRRQKEEKRRKLAAMASRRR